MTNQSAPQLTPESKLLCFDVESNGLHGEAFAVGAVLMQLDGTVIDEFSARCPIIGPVDEWVEHNVLPQLGDLPLSHKDARAMRNAFWQWFSSAKPQADYVVVDNGYPVEDRFLLQCQEDNLSDRYWGHAYPLLDVGSLLLQVGIKPLAVKYRLVEDRLGGKVSKHDPRFDARVSALAAAEALSLAGQING